MQTTEADITDLSHDGRGVAHIQGKTVFVAGALPGERVRLRILRRSRSFDEARTEEVLVASPERITPRCAHFGQCSGCSLQHLPPAAQIREAFARQWIERAPAGWYYQDASGAWKRK
jgi:23S rRNA (uracil1939-C5)-methyltransferase